MIEEVLDGLIAPRDIALDLENGVMLDPGSPGNPLPAVGLGGVMLGVLFMLVLGALLVVRRGSV